MQKLKYSSLGFVSGNTSKFEEYRALLGIADLKFYEIAVTEPQTMNLESLVEEKIERIARQLPSTPFFVEHTGLLVDAWKGLPGGLTGVFMQTVGNDGLCKMMTAYRGNDRVARGRVVIGYYYQEHGTYITHGEVVGTIATEPRGSNRFGWDPIFIPNGSKLTYGEMSLEEKNQSSMRSRAAEALTKYLELHFEL